MSQLVKRRTMLNMALVMTTGAWLIGLLRGFIQGAGPSAVLAWVGAAAITWVALSLSRRLRALELARRPRRVLLAVAFGLCWAVAASLGFYNRYGLFDWSWTGELPQAVELSAELGLNQVTCLIVTSVCWGVGIFLGDLRLTPENLRRYFYLGLFLIAIPAVYFVYEVSQDDPFLYLAFLFCGLLTLGLGQIEDVARRSRGGSQAVPFGPYWLLQISLAAVSAIGLALLGWLAGLHRSVGGVLVIVTVVILVALAPCIATYVVLVQSVVPAEEAEPAARPLPPEEEGVGGPAGLVDEETGGATNYICVAAGVVWLFITLALIAWTYRRWREIAVDLRQKKGTMTVSAREVLSAQLDAQLERLQRWIPGSRGLRRRLATRSIRRIYADMSALAAERGFPRLPTTTPYEYLGSAQKAFPGGQAQVLKITEAYVASHYGEVPETAQAIQEIKAAWADLKRIAEQGAAYDRGPTAEDSLDV